MQAQPGSSPPDPCLLERIARMMRASPVAWKSASGGYTEAGRWSMRLSDGRAVFIKAAVEEGTAGWLRTEHAFYRRVRGPFMPALLGWDAGDEGDGEHWPILALEDLGDAAWPPPWRSGMVAAVCDAVAALHATDPPDGLPRLETFRGAFSCWPLVRDEPERFLGLGLCSPAWLERSLPTLIAAEAAAILDGEALLHLDVRSDNLCVRDGRALLVDWNWACLGNPVMDFAAWVPTLHAEGGPMPEDVLPTAPGVPELAAMMAGYWAWNATMAPLRPGCVLRDHQRRWLCSSLLWAARTLRLPPPNSL